MSGGGGGSGYISPQCLSSVVSDLAAATEAGTAGGGAGGSTSSLYVAGVGTGGSGVALSGTGVGGPGGAGRVVVRAVCPLGHYCPGGAAGVVECPLGHYCPAGSDAPVECPGGAVVVGAGFSSEGDCFLEEVFVFTGGVQSYVVPENVTAVVVHVWGAGGGGGKSHCGRMKVFMKEATMMLTLAYVCRVQHLSLLPILLYCARRILGLVACHMTPLGR